MSKIAEMLDGRISFLKDYNGYNMTVNLRKLNRIISYLRKNKLKTKKYIDYLKWIKV
jgi:hypothetical protein